MRKSVSPVVAVIVIVVVVALAVGAYLYGAKHSGVDVKEKGMGMKGGNEPNPNALWKGGPKGPGQAPSAPAQAKDGPPLSGTGGADQ